MFHCFYHERFMPAEAQRGDLQSAQNGAKIQDSLLFTQITPSLIPQWMASLTPSTARPVGHMTVLTPPPRCGRKKASGCINKGAKWEGGPEAEQTRWRWSSLGFTLCLQLQGFFCGPVVGLLHPWSATSTPEVRPQALKCYLDFYILKNMFFFSLPSVVPALCVFEGRHYSLGETWMDACMQCTCLHPVGVGCCGTWVHKLPGVQMLLTM